MRTLKKTAFLGLFFALGISLVHASPFMDLAGVQNAAPAVTACSVNDAEYSPTGETFVTTNGRAIIWNSETLERVHALTLWNNDIRSAAYSPDGRYVVTASDDVVEKRKHVIVWDVNTGLQVRVFENQTAPHFAPDGKTLLTVGKGRLHIWEMATGKLLRTIDNQNGIVSGIEGVTYRPDGKFYATYNSYGFQVWDAAADKRLSHRDVYQVGFADYSPDGNALLTISLSQLNVWNPQNSEHIHSLPGDAHWDARYSPSGRFIIVAYRSQSRLDGKVTIYDAETYEPVADLVGHTSRVTSVSFSPDEKLVLTSSWDGRVILWDAANTAPLHILNGCGGM